MCILCSTMSRRARSTYQWEHNKRTTNRYTPVNWLDTHTHTIRIKTNEIDRSFFFILVLVWFGFHILSFERIRFALSYAGFWLKCKKETLKQFNYVVKMCKCDICWSSRMFRWISVWQFFFWAFLRSLSWITIGAEWKIVSVQYEFMGISLDFHFNTLILMPVEKLRDKEGSVFVFSTVK